MGLDMYLKKEVYISAYKSMADRDIPTYKESYEKALAIAELAGLPLLVDGGVTVSVSAAYWRKANQVHNWFVQNVQDGVDECQPSEIGFDTLAELREVCETVLEDHSKAEDLLPVQAGFFFGGYDYDEYYFQDLEGTVKMIDEVEKHDGPHDWYTYQASW